MFLQVCSKNIYVIQICFLTKVDTMKKSILTLIAASVILISVVHFGITNTDAASVQQKSPYKATNVNEKSIINPSDILAGAIIGNKDNSVRRGATPYSDSRIRTQYKSIETARWRQDHCTRTTNPDRHWGWNPQGNY